MIAKIYFFSYLRQQIMRRNVFLAKKAGFVLLVSMVLTTACHRPRERVQLTEMDCFRDGDMVLRCGGGAESHAVVRHSQSSYSHIGILQYDSLNAEWLVIHAVPGESPVGEKDYVKVEPLTDFYAPERALRGAWMRVDCSDEVARKAACYCRMKFDEKVVFDNKYLLADTTQLYCCELVWRAYLHQGIDISGGKRYDVPTVFCKEGECILPANIENSETTLFVKPFNIKR